MMNTGPVVGAAYLLRGFTLMRTPGLRRFVLIPLAINALIFAWAITYTYRQFEALTTWLLAFLPSWLGWLESLFWQLFILMVILFISFGFTLVANLLGAPFNGLLAEAVERHITGRKPVEGGWTKALRDVLPGLLSELRKLLYFAVRAIPLLVLFLIPVINLAAPFLWMSFSAWMLALQYADYPMANHGLSFTEQRRRLREKPLTSLGFGGATLFATLIPGINLIVMPMAVAGATAMWVEQFANDRLDGSGLVNASHQSKIHKSAAGGAR